MLTPLLVVAADFSCVPSAREQDAENNVAAHDVEATALANQAQTDDISADSEQLLEADQALTQAPNKQADDETSEVKHTETAETNIEGNDVVSATAEVEQPTKEENQAAKSKTTIASYKNMIENVAEQLLPQTGMFNLTTPKVPKARSRKPKTEHKKPTQAEKLESDNTDSDS